MSSEQGQGTRSQRVEFTARDGVARNAYLALPPFGSGPGVLLLAGLDGPIETLWRFCDDLAEDGYVALMPDPARDGEETARAGLATLSGYTTADAGAAVIGFGLGSVAAVELAASTEAGVLIAYYPAGIEDRLDLLSRTACPVVLHCAGDDPATPRAVIERLRDMASDRPSQQVFHYDGCAPGFAERGHPAFDKFAAGIAYSRTLAPLRRELGPYFDLAGLFHEHLRHEFETRDADATMRTMVDAPYVNHVPTMTGGVGHDELKRFYKYHFIPKQPKDRKTILVSETVGADTVVLELISCFTHDDPYDHWLPGVPPTGKYCEVPVVVIAKFRGGKLYNEHIYWDHASLLAQLGMIDQDTLPVAGIRGTKKLLDETLPSNEMMPNWHESDGLPL